MVPEAWRRGGLVSTGRVVGVLLLLGALHKASAAVIRYEILEEREKGSVVGNVVRDLDLISAAQQLAGSGWCPS